MSEITFACPYCGIQLSATDEMFGQVTACPGCGQQFQIPQPAPAQAPSAAPRAPRPAPAPARPAPGRAQGRTRQPAALSRQAQAEPPARQAEAPAEPRPEGARGPLGPPMDRRHRVMRTGDWVLVLLLLMVPVVNLVLLFVWAFTQGNLNRRNFARAGLILGGLQLVLVMLFVLAVGLQAQRDPKKAANPVQTILEKVLGAAKDPSGAQ